MGRRLKISTAALLAFAGMTIALVAPGQAQAGLLFTGKGATCDPVPAQAFLAWGDKSQYSMMGGGTFEKGTPAWSLTGGSAIVSGNEPWRVEKDNGTQSLRIPAGGTATSPTACFTFGDWHFRFFVKNVGAPNGTLRAEIVVRNLLGILSTLDGGVVKADGTWDPSPRVGALLSNVCALLPTTKSVAIRLRAVGTGAAFQVDDVYLDPWKSF